MTHQRRSKDQIAALVAQDIPNGAFVNLGIGMPTLVANHLPAGLEIILHSENGILGMGPAPAEADQDFDLINAGKQPVTLLPGGAFFHHADSFAMMRVRSAPPATWPIGTPASREPFRRWVGPWIWPWVPSKPG